jgi:hypothetical protein
MLLLLYRLSIAMYNSDGIISSANSQKDQTEYKFDW